MIVGILVSWRTPDNRWLVDRVIGEGDVAYQVFEEGELAAELRGPIERLREWLTRRGVDLGDLIPLEDEDDPWSE